MIKTKLLKTGDYHVSKNYNFLTTKGIGSCVVICLFEKKNKIAAMAHMLLPHQEGVHPGSMDYKIGQSPESAIPHMLNEIIAMGGDIENLRISLIGAGNMFPSIAEGGFANIGNEILLATKNELEKHNLKNYCRIS